MANINVNLDWDDFLWECSQTEKQKIIDSLWDDGYVPNTVSDGEFEMVATTHTESELIAVLHNIWRNRLFIDMRDIESLNHYANKGAYEN
jgi:steroid 5-alpha reductase family enzyme